MRFLILEKKTCILVLCYEMVSKSRIDTMLKLIKSDFKLGLKEFRDIINKYKIKDLIQKEVLSYLTKANNQIMKSHIKLDSLLYFNNIIKNRGK